MLRPDATVRIDDESLELEIEDYVFTVTGLPPVALRHALTAMNGHLLPSEVARLSSLSEATVHKLIEQLTRQGALVSVPRHADLEMNPAEFSSLCRRLNEHWKRRLFSHPLWTGLADGTLPRQVFIGWVVETMWFIDGVIDRLPMAVAFSEDHQARRIFSQHFSEEWDHFKFFTQALDVLGVDATQRSAGQPLPATRAVQHWLRAAARRDVLRYAVCSGFLESTGKDRLAAAQFFRQVDACYDNQGGRAVRPMAAHVALDEQYGHGRFLDKVLPHLGHLDAERTRAAIQNAFGLVETLEMWSSDILTHYQLPHALPLRSTRRYRGGHHA
jgi:hypothetical protein